ncbi:shufflon system plasmid conjugative transfer pilus tip adhesin PilV [Paenibacillus ehimensis]|uniref:shufflon system plasmid conjugative transfer pilus tip adhesin PilV n=1 Tax=Paenibacillus ehimensis TaxID=79264 RepID=UPI000472ED83|nr:shufflon system plasmid conjugative transfer pilus tip adhesin PilV [Paenibacillus ehimensis]
MAFKFTMTKKGLDLQSKAQAGSRLQYTRIAVGDGEFTGSIPDLNALVSQKKSLPITKLTSLSGGKAVVGASFSNTGLVTGFYFRELGVFAQDPDIGEILYCYANSGAGAEFIPPGDASNIVEKIIDALVIVGTASNVTAIIDDSLVFATAKEFNAHTSRKDNPHGVTVAQIGAETPDGAQSKVDTHANQTSGVHGATAAATANRIMQRDAAGRAKVAAPAAADDIARKQETDAALKAGQDAQTRAASCLPKNGSEPMTGRLVVPAGPGGGIAFPDNPFGGSGDSASVTLRQKSGEDMELTFEVQNDPADTINFITPSNTGLKANGSTVWHMGNDGWGSGLDADVLRGMAPTDQAHGNSIMQRRADGGTEVATIYAHSWFRSRGQTGWYSEDYGGGWHMTDTSWIRAYNGKSVYTSGHLSADGEIYLRGTALAATRLNNGLLEFWNGSWWQPVGGIKEVQRGEAFVREADGAVTVGINPVNLKKSWINFPNTGGTSSSSWGSGWAKFLDSTHIQIKASVGGTYQWEVVEYY